MKAETDVEFTKRMCEKVKRTFTGECKIRTALRLKEEAVKSNAHPKFIERVEKEYTKELQDFHESMKRWKPYKKWAEGHNVLLEVDLVE